MKKITQEKREKGITLIALVVTIVVLLILAGVSINLIIGQNGLIEKAKEAKENTEQNNVKEIIKLAYSTCMTNKQLSNEETISKESIDKEISIGKIIKWIYNDGEYYLKYNYTPENKEYNIKIDKNEEITFLNEKEHYYLLELIEEPTCSEKGYKKYSCVWCNDNYREEIETLIHSWSEENDGIFTCSVCGATSASKEKDIISGSLRKFCII